MNICCPFCGITHNDQLISSKVEWYFFACGNAYDKKIDFWIDICCNEVTFP